MLTLLFTNIGDIIRGSLCCSMELNVALVPEHKLNYRDKAAFNYHNILTQKHKSNASKKKKKKRTRKKIKFVAHFKRVVLHSLMAVLRMQFTWRLLTPLHILFEFELNLNIILFLNFCLNCFLFIEVIKF